MRKAFYALAALAVLIPGGTYAYINWIRDDAPPPLSLPTDAPPTSAGAQATGSIEGSWRAAAGSRAGYRVKEVLFGQRAEAVGRTERVTGTMTITGTTVAAVDLTVDMASMTSGESRRDGQFRGRIMDVSRFPTSTFRLTQPLSLSAVPADSSPVRVTATGDLTLRGTTKRMDIPLEARRNGARIEVTGSLPVVFADWGIPNPSFGPATTEDNGVLELLVVFERA
jgi:polyisoprenoid-binding protein YceI